MESESIFSDRSQSHLKFADSAVLISWGSRMEKMEGREGRKKASTWWMN